jgi:hypothetical protein
MVPTVSEEWGSEVALRKAGFHQLTWRRHVTAAATSRVAVLRAVITASSLRSYNAVNNGEGRRWCQPRAGLQPSAKKDACPQRRAASERNQNTRRRTARRRMRRSAGRETRGDDAGWAPAQHDPRGARRAAPQRAARPPPRATPEHQKVSFFTSSWKLEAFTRRRAARTAKHHANLRFKPARRVQNVPGRRGVPTTIDTLCVTALRSPRAPLRAAPRRAGEPPRVHGPGPCAANALRKRRTETTPPSGSP